jgi:hypothetical protein
VERDGDGVEESYGVQRNGGAQPEDTHILHEIPVYRVVEFIAVGFVLSVPRFLPVAVAQKTVLLLALELGLKHIELPQYFGAVSIRRPAEDRFHN